MYSRLPIPNWVIVSSIACSCLSQTPSLPSSRSLALWLNSTTLFGSLSSAILSTQPNRTKLLYLDVIDSSLLNSHNFSSLSFRTLYPLANRLQKSDLLINNNFSVFRFIDRTSLQVCSSIECIRMLINFGSTVFHSSPIWLSSPVCSCRECLYRWFRSVTSIYNCDST